jgi:hypothetical protein
MNRIADCRNLFCVILLLLAQTTGLESAAAVAAASKPRVQIIEPGDFHGEDIPFKKGGDRWIGLFPEGKDLIWRETLLRLKYEHDDVGDDPPGALTGKRLYIKASPQPLFLVRGLSGLIGTPVTTAWRETKEDVSDGDLVASSVRKINLEGTEYSLEVVNPHPGENGELGIGAAVILHAGKVSQVLYSLPSGGNDASWTLHWAGDLDGDGKLDLYMSLSDHYNVDQRILFLSRYAQKGQLVRAVASFRTVGC